MRTQPPGWRTPLPFPVPVVAGVESIDAISGSRLTTTYAYRHGYWDGVDREFRGFARVAQRDTETTQTPGQYHTPPTETRTWFHIGPVGDDAGGWGECDLSGEYWSGDPAMLTAPSPSGGRDALRAWRGSVLRTELYGLDGSDRQDRPYTVIEHRYGLRQVQDTVWFPYATAQRVTQWERGAEPMTGFTFVGDHDGYGQPRSTVEMAVPRGRDPGSPARPARRTWPPTPSLSTPSATTCGWRAPVGPGPVEAHRGHVAAHPGRGGLAYRSVRPVAV